jgi:hypothetical protein
MLRVWLPLHANLRRELSVLHGAKNENEEGEGETALAETDQFHVAYAT